MLQKFRISFRAVLQDIGASGASIAQKIFHENEKKP